MTDLTRKHKFGEKKTKSVSAARLQLADVLGEGTNTLNLFNLPPNAIVTDAYIVVDNATQAAITCDFGFSGGSELINDADMATTGVKQTAEVSTLTTLTGTVTALTLAEGTPNTLTSGTVALTSGAGTVVKAPKLLTGTGKVVTAKFSAEPNEAFDAHFVVEYTEYTLGNGNLTTVTAA